MMLDTRWPVQEQEADKERTSVQRDLQVVVLEEPSHNREDASVKGSSVTVSQPASRSCSREERL